MVRSDEEVGGANIYARRMSGDTAARPLVVDPGVSLQLNLSPDGRWLAWSDNTTGQQEVYVAPFPGMESRRLVSTGGGTEPRWAHSGKELFFKSGGKFMAVDVIPGPSFNFGTPHPLFALDGYLNARNRQEYDVAPDDNHFLMIRDHGEANQQIIYVENWFTELKAKLAVK